LLLLGVVIAFSPLAEEIPHAVLAGILVKVGYDIIDWSYLKRAHKGPRWDLILMVLVLVLTVFVDLITAVAVGMVLAALAFVKQMGDLQIQKMVTQVADIASPEEAELYEKLRNKVTLFELNGPLSFGAAADLGHHVRVSSKNQGVVILDFATVPFMDLSAAKAVETIATDVKSSGRVLYIAHANKEVVDTLSGLGIKEEVKAEHWFATRLEALKAAEQALANGDAPAAA